MSRGIAMVRTCDGQALDLGHGPLIPCEPGWVLETSGTVLFLPATAYERLPDPAPGSVRLKHRKEPYEVTVATIRCRVSEITERDGQFTLMMTK